MKYQLVLFFLTMSVVFVSCRKNEKMQFRFKGYIYNKNDSTPFANTNFKLFEHSWNSQPAYRETYFTTDENGYFDLTNDGKQGRSPAWPSYVDGAAYLGPPRMQMDSITGSYHQDFENHVTTINFGNLYTTPYY
jgi:hypothetical protein